MKIKIATETRFPPTDANNKYVRGPKAFCTGTLLPCTAGNRCKHFGVHHCSTFKRHKTKACPHHPQHEFMCTKL